MSTPQILLGANSQGEQIFLNLPMANRHGLIAGATGTGKTVTLQVLAEGFARQGVPVFMADVKGDLSGLARAANEHPKIQERIEKIKIEKYQARGYPTVFWDVFGKQGHPLRTTISEMGPLLLSRVLQLNDIQESILHILFEIADDQGLLLVDMKDLRSLVQWAADNSKELKTEYGNMSGASLGAIQRQLIVLENAGGEIFFAEPALQLAHLTQYDFSGNGVIGILDATKLINDSRMYGTFLLWLLSELFEQLPEVGDQDKPKMIFFFDEAHLLFDDAPKILVDKIEQVVRLIRSKGVGIFFVTQNPLDIPETVLGQLGHKVQHALRAFTPKDQKAVRVAAETFRANPDFSTEAVITELGVGEALVSVLDLKGSPTQVENTLMCPPESRIGPMSPEERVEQMSRSPLKGLYDKAIDRESAFEVLKKRREEAEAIASKAAAEKAAAKEAAAAEKASRPRGRKRQSYAEAITKSMLRTMGRQAGRSIMRGLLGSIFGGR